MLTWVGKQPLSHVTAFPVQHVETHDALGIHGLPSHDPETGDPADGLLPRPPRLLERGLLGGHPGSPTPRPGVSSTTVTTKKSERSAFFEKTPVKLLRWNSCYGANGIDSRFAER
jgi:hypothetical protein